MEVSNISDLNLNDSEILQTFVTGSYEIEIHLKYVLDYASQQFCAKKLVFQDCLSAELQLNLAFQGPNSILQASEVPAEEGHRTFTIETNTTASLITVTAKRLSLI